MDENYNSRFSVKVQYNDYIVRDHEVHNVRIMPGVTFLDILCRYFLSKGISIQKLEIRNVLFYEPVAVTASYDKIIKFDIHKSQNHWNINARSQKTKDDRTIDYTWNDNFSCELHFSENILTKNLNISNLKNTKNYYVDMDRVYSHLRERNICHGVFMKALGGLYVGEDFILSEIHLSDLAQEYLNDFYLHPAFLDSSTIIPFIFDIDEKNDDKKPYIPIHIESFRATNHLTDKCYVYVKKPKNENKNKDVIYASYEIYNSDGKLAVVMNKLAVKLIRSEILINKLESLDAQNEIQYNNSVDQMENLYGLQDNVPYETVPNKDKNVVLTANVDKEKLHRLIVDDMRGIVARALGKQINEISPDAEFYDIGLDSTKLLKLVKVMENRLGDKLYPTLLFEYNNLNLLAGYFADEYGEKYFADKKHEQTFSSSKIEPFYFYPSWVKIEYPTDNYQSNESLTDAVDNVLIFDNGMDLYNAFKSGYTKNVKVILIKPGKNYQYKNNDTYIINPSNSHDYQKLFKSLDSRKIIIKKIIYKWTNDKFSYREGDINKMMTSGFYSLFILTKLLMSRKQSNNINLLYVYERGQDSFLPHYAAAGSFIKTLHLENPRFTYKSIEMIKTPEMEHGKRMTDHVSILTTEFHSTDAFQNIRYIGKQRYTQKMTEFKIEDTSMYESNRLVRLKENGVYLISGGAGGLGLIFAECIAKQVKACIILTGRSKLDAVKKSRIEKIRSLGSEVTYIPSDVSRLDDVLKLVKNIKAKYKVIDGVIHGAGIFNDSLIVNKSKEEIPTVFESKIFGTIYLDKTLQKEKLDFFLLFSSLSAVSGNPGQSDYSYANSFLDHFAEMRETLRNKKKRYGKTLSINWPLWEEGGMKIDHDIQTAIEDLTGIKPLRTEIGLHAFLKGLSLNKYQILVLEGDGRKIFNLLKTSGMKEDVNSDKLIDNKHETALHKSNISTIDDKINTPDASINIIGINERLSMKDKSYDYWDRLKQHKLTLLSNDNVINEYINLSLKYTKNLFRLLVRTSSNKKMEVYMCGKGQPIILIPPFAMTVPVWSYQIRALSEKYKVIVIHLPGHGLSQSDKNINIPKISADIIKLLDELTTEFPAHLIGASYGGVIAQTLAANFPDKFSSLILSNSFTSIKTEFYSLSLEESFNIFSDLWTKDINNIVQDPVKNNKYRNLILLSQSLDPLSALIYMDLLPTTTTRNMLKNIKIPTLIIDSENDLFKDKLYNIDEPSILKSNISSSKIYIFPDAGHFPYLTHHEEFNNKILNFLDDKKSIYLVDNVIAKSGKSNVHKDRSRWMVKKQI